MDLLLIPAPSLRSFLNVVIHQILYMENGVDDSINTIVQLGGSDRVLVQCLPCGR